MRTFLSFHCNPSLFILNTTYKVQFYSIYCTFITWMTVRARHEALNSTSAMQNNCTKSPGNRSHTADRGTSVPCRTQGGVKRRIRTSLWWQVNSLWLKHQVKWQWFGNSDSNPLAAVCIWNHTRFLISLSLLLLQMWLLIQCTWHRLNIQERGCPEHNSSSTSYQHPYYRTITQRSENQHYNCKYFYSN